MIAARSIFLAAALAALVACAQSEESDATAGSAAATDVPAETAADHSMAAGLVLGGDGLAANNGDVSSQFGQPRDETVAWVTERLGFEPTDTGTNEECGAGPMQFTYFGDLTLNFQDGEWVGWSMTRSPGTPPMATAQTIAIGSPRSEVEAAGAAFEETTIGTEFYLGEISGLVSEGPDATVTDLWAGTNCIFR